MNTPPPGGMVQAVGDTANRVVASLSGTPTLLVMVLLNIGMMATAGWYLSTQEGYRHTERVEMMKAMYQCVRALDPGVRPPHETGGPP